MASSIPSRDLAGIAARLRTANAKLAAAYPGDATARQPVHTLFAAADAFTRVSAHSVRRDRHRQARRVCAYPVRLRQGGGPLDRLADTVRERVFDKLRREPVEDLRLDFEDGYGTRPDAEEDGHAQSAAQEVAAGMIAGTLPPFIGIRIKPMSSELHARSLRTLDLFVTTLVKAGKAAARQLRDHDAKGDDARARRRPSRAPARRSSGKLKLKRDSLRLELMIETPQSILAPDGTSALRALVGRRRRPRARRAFRHLRLHRALRHHRVVAASCATSACDFARHMMQVALAQTGVCSSTARATSCRFPHLPRPGRPLTDAQWRENTTEVHGAWKTHFADVTHSLVNGYYQGWDLHPGAIADPLCGGLRVLSVGAAGGDGAAEEILRQGRPGRARRSTTRRRARRC